MSKALCTLSTAQTQKLRVVDKAKPLADTTLPTSTHKKNRNTRRIFHIVPPLKLLCYGQGARTTKSCLGCIGHKNITPLPNLNRCLRSEIFVFDEATCLAPPLLSFKYSGKIMSWQLSIKTTHDQNDSSHT